MSLFPLNTNVHKDDAWIVAIIQQKRKSVFYNQLGMTGAAILSLLIPALIYFGWDYEYRSQNMLRADMNKTLPDASKHDLYTEITGACTGTQEVVTHKSDKSYSYRACYPCAESEGKSSKVIILKTEIASYASTGSEPALLRGRLIKYDYSLPEQTLRQLGISNSQRPSYLLEIDNSPERIDTEVRNIALMILAMGLLLTVVLVYNLVQLQKGIDYFEMALQKRIAERKEKKMEEMRYSADARSVNPARPGSNLRDYPDLR